MTVATIVDVRPKRGRGPGTVVFDSGVEATTFDPVLLKQAVEAKHSSVEYTVQDKPSKDGSKTYTNLVSLVAGGPGDPGTGTGGSVPEGSGPPPQTGDPTVGPVVVQIPPTLRLDMRASPGSALGGPASLVPTDRGTALDRLELSYAIAVRRHELILELLRSRMREGTHYVDGAMFGAKKPVLLQPGAHAIFQAVGFSCVPSVLHGPLEAPDDPKQRYTIVVRAEVFDAEGRIAGVQMGSCSSHIYSSRQTGYVPRAVDPDKTHNSTLKMATKRATVAACRQTTPASELFAEDLEEGGYGDDPSARPSDRPSDTAGPAGPSGQPDRSRRSGFKFRGRPQPRP